MVKIKYACNRDWHLMSKKTESTRHCEDCNKEITDYTKEKSIENGANCGHFNVSQVSEVKKQLNISKFGLYTVSLLTVLGVSGLSNPMIAQEPKTDVQTQKDQTGKVKIKGIVKDKGNNKPLSFVNIEARTENKLIAVAQTDFDGKFELQVDTSNYLISNIDITFNYTGYDGDTIRTTNISKYLLDKEVVIDLETAIDLKEIEVTEYQLTGLIEIEADKPKIKEINTAPNRVDSTVPK